MDFRVLLILLIFLVSCTPDVEIDQQTHYQRQFLNHNDTVKYMGMDVCQECHKHIYDTYMRTGMGLSFDSATREKSMSKLNRNSIAYDEFQDLYYHPYWKDDQIRLAEFRLNGRDTIYYREEIVDYVIGSGQHTNSHLYNVNGYVYQVPFTYYTQDDILDFPPGFSGGKNSRFGRQIGLECMSCHNGFPDFVMGSENKYREVPRGIDCERCHGPAEIHVAMRRHGFITDTSKYTDYSIVNPAKLTKELQNDLCARCHLQGTMVLKNGHSFYDFKPGMNLTDYIDIFMPVYEGEGKEDFIMASHYERMRESKCYLESEGQLSCSNCHNPHISHLDEKREKFINDCIRCHQTEEQTVCSESIEVRNTRNNDCIECHMPVSYTRDIPHVTIHDHKVAIEWGDPEKDRTIVQLKAINNPNTDGLTRARGYLKEYETFESNPLYLDSARRFLLPDQKRTYSDLEFNTLINYHFLLNQHQEIIKLVNEVGMDLTHNSKLTTQNYSNDDAWTAYRIGQSFENTGDIQNALGFYEKAIELAPFNLEFQNKYGSTLAVLNRFEEARKVMNYILDEDPKYVSAYVNLGFIFLSEGQIESAEYLYDQALALNPDYVQALLNKAGIYFLKKDYSKASQYIERVLELEPENEQAKIARQQLQLINN